MGVTMISGSEVRVRCLLLFGDLAELQVPGWDEPARWPTAAITADTGLDAGALPGREFVVTYRETLDEGRTFSQFRLADPHQP